MSNMRLIRNSVFAGKKEDRNKFRISVIPTVAEDISRVAMRFWKDLRKRSGYPRHARMIRAKNFKPAIKRPTQQEFDAKYSRDNK